MNSMKRRYWLRSPAALSLIACSYCCISAAAPPAGSAPQDFAYRMQVSGAAGAAAYRVDLPLAVYRKVVYPELSDIRVFNANGEQVPFVLEQPASGTAAAAAVLLGLFPLKDDSNATFDALRVTIESGKNAINVRAAGQSRPGGRVATYLVDGRTLEAPVAALQLSWPEDAADFAGRVKVEASDDLASWQLAAGAAPVANLHADSGRLVEQRVELPPTRAKYWRLSWVGTAAPFVLTSVRGEPAKQNVEAKRESLTVSATEAAKHPPGEFVYALHARVPVDRINLELPEPNTVVEVELLSRTRMSEPWDPVRTCGFYRLNSDGAELRNGPVPVPVNARGSWLLRTDPDRGGLGKAAPRLVVEWVPHQLVFVARGSAPFYLAYGSMAVTRTAALALDFLPKNLLIARGSLSTPEPLGGEGRLKPLPEPYAWKAALLWIVLFAGAGLLAWMAFRLSKDVQRG